MNWSFIGGTILAFILFLGSFKEELVGTSIPMNVAFALFVGFVWGSSLDTGSKSK